jgi:hypothetical protein
MRQLLSSSFLPSPATWVAKAERSRVQGQPGLHSEFKAHLGYIVRLFVLKKSQINRNSIE